MSKIKILENMIRTEVRKQINEESDTYSSIYNSIDWDKVGQAILKNFKIKTQLRFTQNGRYVRMESDNFINQCGIFKYAIGSCYLSFFSNRLIDDPNSKEKFWAQINLSYPGNGMTIGTVWVTQDDRIVVRVDTPRT